jgi:MFS family permease
MRGTRLAITVCFYLDGVLLGSWAARIPAVQRHAGLTNARLGLALFAMSVGALVAMPLAGWLSERIGSRGVTMAGLLGGAVALVGTSLAGGFGGVAVSLLGFGAGFGSINVAANAQGIALERRYGRAILSSFHAAFSTGGLTGAGAGALIAAAGVGPQSHFAVLALVAAVAAAAAGPQLLPHEPAPSRPVVVRPPRVLLVLGAAAFFTLLAEGAAADWSAVYLSGSLGAGAAVAALGYTAFSLAMAASRAFGDRLNDRVGPGSLARTGAMVASAGLAVALAVGTSPAALVGFGAMGSGLGVIVPVLFRAAGSTPGVSASVGVAAVSTIGWLGFLTGPPTIGLVAGAVGLRSALAIVVAATAMVALLARAAEPGRGPSVTARWPRTTPGSALNRCD